MLLFGNDIISILYFIPALLISLAVHEASHAYTAYKLGDRSQKLLGRMSLDPLAHIDILGFISIILVGFGWGKPVLVDDSSFKNKKRDNMLVAIAGPISNLVIAVFFTIILKLLYIFDVNLIQNNIINVLLTMIQLTIKFNVVFAVFNMLPLPPFDGSKILMYFLPYKFKNIMDSLEKYSFFIIIILLVTGTVNYIIMPFVNGIEYILNIILKL
ncbi:MAG: site-2 protease family protein [Clostridia bacterium]